MKQFFIVDVFILKEVLRVILNSLVIVLIIFFVGSLYIGGYSSGYVVGFNDADATYRSYLSAKAKENVPVVESISNTPIPTQTTLLMKKTPWGGPDLWTAVNKRRQALGVNSLDQRDDLCTIAAIRLNELLELGKLDGHEGFGTMEERRPDLKPIFERYGNVAEFLASGGDSASETVSLWENTLAHKKLLTGGEYVWGCIYAQNTFAVAITAY